MKKWLVAYVRLHHEKKTAERLTAMNIENFLPVQEEIRQWTYRKKKIKRVVIPMMIFVHVDAAERSQVLTLSAISRRSSAQSSRDNRRPRQRAPTCWTT